MQTLLRCPYTPVCSARQRPRSPCQTSMDNRNAKTPSVHRRLDSATLSQLVFPGESKPAFPMGEIPLGQNSGKQNKKVHKMKVKAGELLHDFGYVYLKVTNLFLQQIRLRDFTSWATARFTTYLFCPLLCQPKKKTPSHPPPKKNLRPSTLCAAYCQPRDNTYLLSTQKLHREHAFRTHYLSPV